MEEKKKMSFELDDLFESSGEDWCEHRCERRGHYFAPMHDGELRADDHELQCVVCGVVARRDQIRDSRGRKPN